MSLYAGLSPGRIGKKMAVEAFSVAGAAGTPPMECWREGMIPVILLVLLTAGRSTVKIGEELPSSALS
jgi:hypothetical protein